MSRGTRSRTGHPRGGGFRARCGAAALGVAVVAFVAGCGQKESWQLMAQQPRYEPYEASSFFADGTSARPLVPGTVARGHLDADELAYRGTVNGREATVMPFPVTMAVLERGHERFDIYCSPCHDRTGSGNGIVHRRGFTSPPSFHTDTLRRSPIGHFFQVMTLGFGAMPSYAKQIPPEDRWAIAAYIRALQRSQAADLADVPPAERAKLTGGAR